MNRIEALQEINRVEEVHCKPCPITYAKDCAGCQHSMTLQRLGGVLLRSTNEYRANKNQESVEMTSKLNGLTVDQYKTLKGEGMTDKEIREQYDITAGHFSQFKNKNKLVGEFNAHSHNRVVNSDVNKQVNTQVEKPNQDIISLEQYTRAIKAKELVEDRLEKTVDHNKQLVREKEALERKVAEYEEGSDKGLELNEKITHEKSTLEKKLVELDEKYNRLKDVNNSLKDESEKLRTELEEDQSFAKKREERIEELTENNNRFVSQNGKLRNEIQELTKRLSSIPDVQRVVAELELFKDAWYNGLNKQ